MADEKQQLPAQDPLAEYDTKASAPQSQAPDLLPNLPGGLVPAGPHETTQHVLPKGLAVSKNNVHLPTGLVFDDEGTGQIAAPPEQKKPAEPKGWFGQQLDRVKHAVVDNEGPGWLPYDVYMHFLPEEDPLRTANIAKPSDAEIKQRLQARNASQDPTTFESERNLVTRQRQEKALLSKQPEGEERLVSPEKFLTADEKKNNPVLYGILHAVGGLTTQDNMEVMAGSGGLGFFGEAAAVTPKLGVLATAVSKLPQVVSAYFAGQMGVGVAQQIPGLIEAKQQYDDAIQAGDQKKADDIMWNMKEQAAEMGVNAYMTYAAAYHAGTGRPEPAAKAASDLTIGLARIAKSKGVDAASTVASNLADFTKAKFTTVADKVGSSLGKSTDFNELVTRAANMLGKKAAPEFSAKVKNVESDLKAILNNDTNNKIVDPKSAAQAIDNHLKTAIDAPLLQEAGATKDSAEPVVPNFRQRLEERLDKFFSDTAGRYASGDQVEKAKQRILDRVEMQHDFGNGITVPRDPNLFESENIRQGLNAEGAASPFEDSANIESNAYKAAARETAAFMRETIDEAYDAKGVRGVKEAREKEANLIDVRDALYDAQGAADKLKATPSILKLFSLGKMVGMIGAIGAHFASSNLLAGTLAVGTLWKHVHETNVRDVVGNLERAKSIAGREPGAQATVPEPGGPEVQGPSPAPPTPPTTPPPGAPEGFPPPPQPPVPVKPPAVNHRLYGALSSYFGEFLGARPYQDLLQEFSNQVADMKQDIKDKGGKYSQDMIDKAMKLQEKINDAHSQEHEYVEKQNAANQAKYEKEKTKYEQKLKAEMAKQEQQRQTEAKQKDDNLKASLLTDERIAHSPVLKATEEPMLIEGIGGRSSEQNHAHEHGHMMAAVAEGLEPTQFISDQHPDAKEDGTAAAVYIDTSMAEKGPKGIAQKVVATLGGPAYDEVHFGIKMSKNHGARSDIARARQLLREDGGLRGAGLEKVFDALYDRAKEHVSNPEALAIAQANAKVREAGLDTRYHMSAGRMTEYVKKLQGVYGHAKASNTEVLREGDAGRGDEEGKPDDTGGAGKEQAGASKGVRAEALRESGEGGGRKPGGLAKAALQSSQTEFYHGSPSGELYDNPYGIHVGSRKAAKEAIEARIGIPAEGEWDGSREYGKTKLMGQKTMRERGIFPTGYNVDAPEEDYFPTGAAAYSTGDKVSLNSKPNVFKVKITGEMANVPTKPRSDFATGSRMVRELKEGKAAKGYYYKNVGEDEGSISAVVPGKLYLERTPEITEAAIKHYGLTDEPRKTGYILPTGKGLDFSEGQQSRVLDHGDVSEVMKAGRGENPREAFTRETKAARFMQSSFGTEVTLPKEGATSEQIEFITRAAEQHPRGKKEVSIDVLGDKGVAGSSRANVESREDVERLVRDAQRDASSREAAAPRTKAATEKVALKSGIAEPETEMERDRRNPPRAAFPETVAEHANAFNKQTGREPVNAEPIQHSPETANRIARAYEAMPHNPADPAVQKSYDAMKKDVDAQWDYAVGSMGMQFEPWKRSGQPYADSKEMMADVKNNKHLYFFQGGELPADHPMADVDPKTGFSYNDKLRAVHDLFGHAAHGFQFGPKGEENAWNVHRQMFSPEAVPAITTETRGQNSWVNFGEHLRNAEGKIPAKGEPGYVPPAERPYAQNKAGLLPAEFHSPKGPEPEGPKGGKKDWAEGIAGNLEKAPAGGVNPNSPETPSKRYGLELVPEARKPLGANPTADDFRNYAQQEDVQGHLATHPDIKLGWDTTGEKPELNVGVSTDDKAAALDVAKKLDQRAIWDNQEEKVVPVGGEGKQTSFPDYPVENRLRDLGIEKVSLKKDYPKDEKDNPVWDKLTPDQMSQAIKDSAYATYNLDDVKEGTPWLSEADKQEGKIPALKADHGSEAGFLHPDGSMSMIGDSFLHDVFSKEIGLKNTDLVKKAGIGTYDIWQASTATRYGGHTGIAFDLAAAPTPEQIQAIAALTKHMREGEPDTFQSVHVTWPGGEKGIEFPTPGKVVQALKGVEKASLKKSPKGSSVPLMDNPLPVKGTMEGGEVGTLDLMKALNTFSRKQLPALKPGEAEPKEMVERAKKIAEDEAKYQLAQSKTGTEWYTTEMKEHDKVLQGLRPELAEGETTSGTDKHPVSLTLFKAAEAILSSGQKPYANVKSALKAWDLYKETHEFPRINPETGKSWGPRGVNAYGSAFDSLNKLIQEKGEKGAADWLLSEHPVKELRSYQAPGQSPVKGKAADNETGAMILGAKRGPFMQNLHGIESKFTADMWVSRTWNRWMGTLDLDPRIEAKGKMTSESDAPRNNTERTLMKESFEKTAKKLKLTTSSLQAVLWYYEQALYRAHGLPVESWSFSDAAKRVANEQPGEEEQTAFPFGESAKGKGVEEGLTRLVKASPSKFANISGQNR